MTAGNANVAMDPEMQELEVRNPKTGMTLNENKTLSARVVFDPQFRERLLRNPREAARTLGIEITDWEHDEILRYTAEIRAYGRKIDGVLGREGMKAVIDSLLFV